MEKKVKTRESKKKLYCSNFYEVFKWEMRETMWAEDRMEKCINTYAESNYKQRKEDIETKGDALMYGIIDAREYCNKIKQECRK